MGSLIFFLTKLKVIKIELVNRHVNTRFSFGKDENTELGDTCEVTVLVLREQRVKETRG